jgi:hypothetical protein
MKFPIYLLACICAISLSAQNKKLNTGLIKDSVTQSRVAFTAITNINSRKTVISNKNGVFHLLLTENSLLSFAAVGYNFDTLRITREMLSNDTLTILLKPLTKSLESVTVYSKIKYNSYQMDSIKRRNEFFLNKSDYAIPTFSNGNSGSGIGFNLDHFYGREKRKRKVISLFELMEQEQYINYRYNPELVFEYTELADDTLSLFMQQSRPNYNWLRTHTEKEDLLYYINDQLKIFQQKSK